MLVIQQSRESSLTGVDIYKNAFALVFVVPLAFDVSIGEKDGISGILAISGIRGKQ
jgi:hypothetical protein